MTDTPPGHEIVKGHLDRLLSSREPPKTICPSEVVRAFSREECASSWRELMSEIRNMVAEMQDRGEVEVLQKGTVLGGDLGEGLVDVKGPIRVRRVA